ncbi:MAG: GGDEF domain-containing protein [Lachnospiraceae bacterium]|nr:GGDEF domain-containing protein [Lachnospiraceae bacterium]
MNIRKLSGYAMAITTIILFVVVILSAMNEKTEDIVIKIDRSSPAGIEWQVSGTSDKDFPVVLSNMAGKTIELKSVLPDKIEDNYGMMFNTIFSKCVVKVDGKKIASFAEDITGVKGKMVGDVHFIVPITQDMAGKEIVINIMPYHSIRLNVERPKFANLDALRGSVIQKNLIHFIIVVFMTCVLLSCIGFMIYQARKGNKKIVPVYLRFMGIVLLSTVWIFCNSDIPQFLTNRAQTVSIIGTLALSMIAIPYMGYFSYIVKSSTNFFKVMELVGWFCPISVILGYISNIYDPIDVLGISHLYILVAGFGSFVYAAVDFKDGDFRRRLVLVEAITMVLTTTLSLISYLTAPSGRQFAVIGGAGLLLFVAELVSLLVYDETNYIKERKYQDTYNELSFKDVLTQIGNRAAFDKRLDDLAGSFDEKYATLILFDLSCLREVNDNYGFDEGDSYIKGFAECLKKVYEPKGDYFRLGGDEFAVLVPGKTFEPEESVEELQKEVNYYNRTEKRNLSFVSGWVRRELSTEPEFKKDFYRHADQSLCAMKIRQNFAAGEQFKEE